MVMEKSELSQSQAFAQELSQKLESTQGNEHEHVDYQPVPQVPPVIAEQTKPQTEPPAQAPAAQSAQLPPQPQPAPTPTPTTTQAAASSVDNQDLQAKMAAAGLAGADNTPAQTPTTSSAQVVDPSSVPTQSTSNVTLTTEPNIINGVVTDQQGQFIPGVIVVVKNAQGESKRALKTNKLGQFVVTTPLTNGTYTVEVDKKGLTFDIMKVDLTGEVLAPITIKSKQAS